MATRRREKPEVWGLRKEMTRGKARIAIANGYGYGYGCEIFLYFEVWTGIREPSSFCLTLRAVWM